MELSKKQKIGIGIGVGLLIGCVIYFGFIRKSDDIVADLQDPSQTGGTSGGVGGSPAGAPTYKGKTDAKTVEETKKALGGRG